MMQRCEIEENIHYKKNVNYIRIFSVCNFWHHKIKFAMNGIRNKVLSVTSENLTTTPNKFYNIIMIFIKLININNMNIILIILNIILII